MLKLQRSSKIIYNTSMLYLLNIAKILFPLITLPYLTRVLSVTWYGVVAYVKAVMQYMQLIVDFGFLLSGTKDIVLAGEDQNKINHEIGNIFLARLLVSGIACAGLCAIIPLISILRESILYTMLSFVVVLLTVFLMDFFFRGIEKMEIITIRFVVMKGLAAAPPAFETSIGVSTSIKPCASRYLRIALMIRERLIKVSLTSSFMIRST